MTLAGLASAAPAQADSEVPILGQVKTVSSQVKTDGDSTRDVLITVHGVRRLDDATAVYYSIGFTPESTAGQNKSDLMLMRGSSSEISPLRGDVDAMGDVAILDIPDAQAFTTMYTGDLTRQADRDCVCRPWLDALPSKPEPGTAYVGMAVLPRIPDALDTVTVRAVGHFFSDIPVEDSAMEPLAKGDGPVVVGEGWPEVDEEAISDVDDPKDFVLPLTTHEVVEDSGLSERSDADSRSLDLSADVLFDVDTATLTNKAKQEIRTAAERIEETDVNGTLTVTGHTDSDGAEDYNQNLSERRAQAVAKALKPLLPSGVSLTTAGKGESKPIAPNDTESGKTLNRRVTITLPEEK